uniref:VPS9 domain-containing protein n=1 Tax=Acrobeloides nanus TaxID=290746 RepID=A0A914C621_9BILA
MKNEFLQASVFWYRYSKEKAQLSFISNNGLNSMPISRYGSYNFSHAHPTYKGCSYEGSWRNGVPHGSGHMVFPEGKEYTGRFINGIIEGVGEMKVSKNATVSTPLMSSVFFTEIPTSIEDDRYDLFKGKFKNGKLHGLASIIWSNGDSFEGYCKNGQPHGHGVYRSVSTNVGQQFYVGAFENGVKHGYGVMSTNKERYLGMWFDDLKHGKGCLITIDGTYHEGIFEKNRFLRGRVWYQPNEDEPPVIFEGEFERIGVISGKGILKMSSSDQVEGTMYGNIQTGDIKISNGTYTRFRKRLDSSAFEHDFIDEKPIENQWAVPAELKWSEIFQQFLMDDLGSENGQNFSNFEESVDDEVIKNISTRAWDRLVGNLTKIKIQKGATFDDRLERIPDPVDAQWSSSYYAMVAEFWHLSVSSSFHPLNRLVQGLIEIFCCSYNNIGTHSVLYDSAVLEFQSLIKRTYDLMRYLFIRLPPAQDMYTPVPNRPDFHHDSEDSSSSTSTAETLSLNSLQNLATYTEDETNESPTSSMHSVNTPDDFSVATPCCDFIINYLFSQCYAEIFTMYSVRLEEKDKKYWERVVYLNAYTDARLLTYLGVKPNLWPVDPENTKELDSFMIRVTAKKKFYESAIQTLQRLSGEFNPSSKLAILAETFSEISACVTQFSPVGRNHIWTSDDLFPAFMYVVVRAQLQHLGAEIRLISDFCPQLNGAGQIELMFTMLRASYVQICSEKSMP